MSKRGLASSRGNVLLALAAFTASLAAGCGPEPAGGTPGEGTAAHARTPDEGALPAGGGAGEADPLAALEDPEAVPAECDLPVQQRSGNWLCPATTPQAAAATVAQAEAELVARGELRAADVSAASTSHCTRQGCWTRLDATRAIFSAIGDYGYGGVVLGTTQFYFRTVMNGSRHTSESFWFGSTRGTRNIVFSGERLYISPAHPGGNSMSPRRSFQRSMGSAGANRTVSWSPGPSTSENTCLQISVAHQVTFSDPSSAYPGQWYTWAKSIKMDRQGSGSGIRYEVRTDLATPANPAGAGWRR